MEIAEAHEALEPQRKEFLIRLYHWALVDAQRETVLDFPFVRSIRNLNTLRFLWFVDALSARDKISFTAALVRRAHSKAIDLVSGLPSTQDLAWLQRYSQAAHGIGTSQVTSGLSPKTKPTIRALIRSRLLSSMGTPLRTQGSLLNNEVKIGSWILRTTIDMGGRRQFGYWHTIEARELVPLAENISFLGWLGISQSDWVYLEEKEVEPAVNCLAFLCSHFLSIAPKLLEGLSHELPKPNVRYWRETVTVERSFKNGYTEVVVDSLIRQRRKQALARWRIPTVIIPEELRVVGARFSLVQDPEFDNPSGDPIINDPSWRHLRVETATRG